MPQDHIIKVAFDAFEYQDYQDSQKLYARLLERIADEDGYYVLFDELQLLTDFEAILNSLIRRKNGDKYDAWRDYVLFGGLPLLFTFYTPDEKSDFLKYLFEKTYIRDIVGRNNVKNEVELEELLNILTSSIGSLTNPHKLANTFKSVKGVEFSQSAIKKYIDYLRG